MQQNKKIKILIFFLAIILLAGINFAETWYITADCQNKGGVCIGSKEKCREGYEESNLACATVNEKCCMLKQKCPDFICTLACEYGFEIVDGCPICKCKEEMPIKCETDKDCSNLVCPTVVGGDKQKCAPNTNKCYCGGVCGDGYCDSYEKRTNTCPADCGECICTEEYKPVCGKDGKTYNNACKAKCARVEVAYQGECKKEEIVDCVKKYGEGYWCADYAEWKKECLGSGSLTKLADNEYCLSDNNKYNYCVTCKDCSDCGKGITNICDEKECLSLGDCVFTPSRLGLGGSCVPKEKCPTFVCTLYCEHGFETGDDGCLICKCKEKPIRCKTDKDCSTVVCPTVVGGDKQKCASDTNKCYCGGVCGDGYCDSYEKRTNTCPADCGECICTEEYKPVCGKDGKTYSNRCKAKCARVDIEYEGECKKEVCTETDEHDSKGIVKGASTGKLYGQGDIKTFEDYCNDNKTVFEYFCKSPGQMIDVSTTYIQCEYGCKDGACLKAQQPTCTDSDGGNNIYTYGSAEGSNGIEKDTCGSMSSTGSITYVSSCSGDNCGIIESICNPSGTSTTMPFQKCPNGCENGACKKEEKLIDCKKEYGKEYWCSDYAGWKLECQGSGYYIKLAENENCLRDGKPYTHCVTCKSCFSYMECKNFPCGDKSKPVCNLDTNKCECLLEVTECICTAEYKPVCGKDGKTYSNTCKAKCAGMDVAYEGECSECKNNGGDCISLKTKCKEGYVDSKFACTTKSEKCCVPKEKCPIVICTLYCEHGFETGADGCPICKCKEEESCTDSDGGKNYFVKGTTTDSKGSFTDYCSGDSLNEYYCYAGKNVNIEQYKCQHGCENGACKKCTATGKETCDGIDDDCDGQIDENISISQPLCGIHECPKDSCYDTNNDKIPDTYFDYVDNCNNQCLKGKCIDCTCQYAIPYTIDTDNDGVQDKCDTEADEKSCRDGKDNDGDGKIDYDDEGCKDMCTSCEACGGSISDLDLCDQSECEEKCGRNCLFIDNIWPVPNKCCVDSDTDGVCDKNDNCPAIYNPEQKDLDRDKKGDLCDEDIDGDGVLNNVDACPTVFWQDEDGCPPIVSCKGTYWCIKSQSKDYKKWYQQCGNTGSSYYLPNNAKCDDTGGDLCVSCEKRFVDCQIAYGQEFKCYTYKEWETAGKSLPLYEVGCDTGGKGYGYCAPASDCEKKKGICIGVKENCMSYSTGTELSKIDYISSDLKCTTTDKKCCVPRCSYRYSEPTYSGPVYDSFNKEYISCSDTDGGMNFYEKGEVSVVYKIYDSSTGTWSKEITGVLQDYCRYGQLTEYYCNGNREWFYQNNCPNCCIDGVCYW